MRFKATFTSKGLRILEKAFLPTLEKCGKTCQLLFGEEDVCFIQTPLNTDGVCASARFQLSMLFYMDTYKISSKHHNLIAFTVDIGLLLRVLRGASTNEAESLDVKLTQKPVPIPGTSATESRPFLSFVSHGASLSLAQDLPITKPYQPAEIDKLVDSREVPLLCPFYVDLGKCVGTLQAMVERMKSISDHLSFAACKTGDVHINVSAVNVTLGLQVPHLEVLGNQTTPSAQVDRHATAEEQLSTALQSGDAVSAHVPLKHISRLLTISSFTGPARILCGVSSQSSYMHVMYVYKDPSKDEAFDQNVSLSFTVPVAEE